jgi:hypothetical protein
MNNAESVRQFQPKVALSQPWGKRIPFFEAFLHPGFQSKPWADISQRFQRYSILGRTP